MIYESSDATVKRYLEDIRKTNPITKKDEQELFRLCRAGNAAARAKLLSVNMRFVLKVALQYRGCPIPLPDLVSEGAMGLVRAIESFDHTRGLKFISYAVWWIKAYITRAINEQGSLIRLPANQHLRVRKALKENANGEALNDEIRELIRLGERGVSFEAPLNEGSKTTFSEVLADKRAGRPDRNTEITEVERFTRDLLAELPEREAKVLKGLYGIGFEAPQTLREVGENLNISHERVRQLRDQALKRLKKSKFKSLLREKFDGYIEATV